MSNASFIPEEALQYLQSKKLTPGFDYRDVWKEEHDNAFTVAKMMQLDLLKDTHEAVAKALSEGQTFEQFRDSLKPTLVKKGWWGKQTIVDPQDDEEKEVQLGSDVRLKTIYQTNMRTARAAGQWERIQRTKDALPYLLYQLGPSMEHRLEHESWNGLLLPIDDPWWAQHTPPNGWGCKCWIRQISRLEAKQLQAKGKVQTEAPETKTRKWVNKRTGEEEVIPEGIEPGWNYNPGARIAKQADNLMAKSITAEPLESAVAVNDVMSIKAISSSVTQEFEDTLERVAAGLAQGKGYATLTAFNLGAFLPEVIEKMKDRGMEVASSVISMRDNEMIHFYRDAKSNRNAAVPIEFVKNLPAHLTTPKAIVIDKQQNEPTLLYIYDAEDDKATKIVIKVNFQYKKKRQVVVTNLIRSGEVVGVLALKDSKQYEVIWGEL